MRILMLSRDRQGADSRSATAARWRRLCVSGVELDVLSASPKEASWQEEGISVTSVGGASAAVRYWRLWRLARRRAHIADVITAQDPFELGAIAYSASRSAVKRFEIQDHGGFFDGQRAEEPAWVVRSRLALWLARRAHRIRTVSPGSLHTLQEAGLGEKTYHLPIAADQRFAHAARHPEPDLIVSVSRLIPVKHVELLLRSFTELKNKRPSAKLVIVGDGPLKQRLQNLAKNFGISENVRFEGEADPLPWLERASAFVLLSSHEGWGVAAVEAALAGVPVVMTDTGCAPWLAEHGRARIVESSDPKDIASVIEGAMARSQIAQPLHIKSPEETAHAQVKAWKELHEEKPRTLICAQAVDEKDPLFGFFVSWLREFSKHGRAIVCALRVSDPPPDLGSGMEIRRTRPAGSRSKVTVIWNIARISWRERFRYDAVFVRGDAQYLACLGWLWRLLGKRIVFWYTHYTAKSPWFWLAAPWAHETVTAVPESNPLRRAVKIGHHIDTERFQPSRAEKGPVPRVLIFGRVSAVKRVPWMLDVLRSYCDAGTIELRILGKALDEDARRRLRAALPSGAVWDDRDVIPADVPGIFADADVVINATPGSMDKTILEAAASGCVVIAATRGIRRGLQESLHWLRFENEYELRGALDRLLRMSAEERRQIGVSLREWVIREHDIRNNVAIVAAFLQERAPRPPLKQRIKRMWWRVRPMTTRGVRVFMFHSFDVKGSAGWDATRFRAFLARLRSADIPCVNFIGAKEGNAVMLTIDDATEDAGRAIDELRRFRMPVTLFAPCGIANLSASDGITRRVLTEEELKRMIVENAGRVQIGGHGRTHRTLVGLDDTSLIEELVTSHDYVVRLNGPTVPPLFAYPRGKWDERVAQAVARAGFYAAFTVEPGTCTEGKNLYRLPRFPVLGWMTSRDVLRSAGLK